MDVKSHEHSDKHISTKVLDQSAIKQTLTMDNDDNQARVITGAMLSNGNDGLNNVIIYGPGGTGKCLGRGTKVLMFDGTTKKVEEILPFDVLMGDDSKSRIVQSVCQGHAYLYRVKTASGDSYVVNDEHIITLKQAYAHILVKKSYGYVVYYPNVESKTYSIIKHIFSTNEKNACLLFCQQLSKQEALIVDIEVLQYLKQTRIWRKLFLTYKVAIEHPIMNVEVDNDPYLIGTWLRECMDREAITIHLKLSDDELYELPEPKSEEWNVTDQTMSYFMTRYGIYNTDCITSFFQDYGLLNELGTCAISVKDFFVTSFNFRMHLVAGLIDESAYLTQDGLTFIIQSSKWTFVKDIERLMRSVGFAAYAYPAKQGYIHQVVIYGNMTGIPSRVYKQETLAKIKSCVLKTSVIREGWGEYFGFVIDGNRRFVLANYIVTHNTHTLRAIATHLTLSKRKIHCTATTGVAALGLSIPELEIPSRTLHSWAGVGLAKGMVVELVRRIKSQPSAMERWTEVEFLMIDEVSMLGAELLDKLNEVAKVVRNSNKPFGGIKLLLSGDFLQLPPVKDGWAFEAICWDTFKLIPFIFKTPKRYDDIAYFEMLLRIREGTHTTEDVKKLTARTVAYKKLMLAMKDSQKGSITTLKPTIMYSTRDDVNLFNQKEMSLLPGEPRTYKAIDHFKKNSAMSSKADDYRMMLDDAISRDVTLKVGAQVMLKANVNISLGLVNGSRGVVLELGLQHVIVRFVNGLKVPITPFEWSIEDKEGRASRLQMPFILAWALTVHKSQGVTLDYAICDIGVTVFSAGQAYVALSRVRNLKGLFISNLDRYCIRADNKALAYSKKLEDYECQAERRFVHLNTDVWKRLNVINVCLHHYGITDQITWHEWLTHNVDMTYVEWLMIYKHGIEQGFSVESVKDIVEGRALLVSMNIITKFDWKDWLLKNHVDKGGNLEKCKLVIVAGKTLGW